MRLKELSEKTRITIAVAANNYLHKTAWLDQIRYFNNRVASRDVSNYYLVYNGEFAYTRALRTDTHLVLLNGIDWYDKGVMSTLYIVFALKHPEKDDSDFMTVFLILTGHRGVADRAAEGARTRLANISADDFKDIDSLCHQ